MKIAFISSLDPSNISLWSGSVFYMYRALSTAGCDVTHITGLSGRISLTTRIKNALYRRYSSHIFMPDRVPSTQRIAANEINRKISDLNPDLIFSPGTLPIAYLRSDIPIAFWTDATFAGMIGFYPEFLRLCAETIHTGNKLEQQVIDNASLALYASDWAAQSAIEHYAADPRKIRIVPFGANISDTRTIADVTDLISRRKNDVCKLLFIGVEWERKGGDLAVLAAKRLNVLGIPTTLDIVGCTPPGTMPEFVRCHGFLSKKKSEDLKTIDRLFADTHFLIVPSRAECYGLVYAEASSYGVPSLATDVGGIPSVIKDGRNGILFPLSANAEQYADVIADYLKNPPIYRDLCLYSFQEYSSRLNWAVAGREVKKHLIAVMNRG